MSERFRHTYAEVNLSALESNFKALQSLIPGGFLAPMIKADAYGHGDIPVAKLCQKLGAKYLGVALLEEGIRLRHAGIDLPILVFAPFDSQAAEALVRYQLTAVLSSFDQISRLRAVVDQEAQYPVHLKFHTGMGRLGFSPDAVASLLEELAKDKSLQVEGVCTHLAMADDYPAGNGVTQNQIRIFQQIVDQLKPLGNIDRHFLNSAGLLSGFQPQFDGARPGIALYGCLPALPVPSPVKLQPAMSVKSTIGLIQRISKGQTVSYNATWKARRDSLIAVVALGYADGWPRALSNKGSALVGGRRVSIAGIVCMDYHMLDVTDVPGVQTGDEVVLIGRQKTERITAEEVALLAGTISYEILTGIQSRVPRVYVH